jgi:hypothetical protein
MNNIYRVITDGTGKWPAGLLLGSVRLHRDGWRFVPAFQRSPSRRGWPTPEAALQGRIDHYKLEPVAVKS